MTDTITLTGLVATIPRNLVTSDKLVITSFRLASTQRRFDRGRNRWVDADTNWYTITTFRQLAVNVQHSVVKGDRVVVTGRLRIREWDTGERTGTTVDIEADAVGHDLSWGTTAFTRVLTSTSTSTAAAAATPTDSDGSTGSAGIIDGWATPGVGTDPAPAVDADIEPTQPGDERDPDERVGAALIPASADVPF